MKLVTVCYTGLFFQISFAMFYPPIFWHKDNCLFHLLQTNQGNGTKELFIKVLPNNGMNIVCPNHVTVNNWLDDAGISSPTLLENMWLVGKDGYDQCKVNGDPKFNKLVLLCDEPRELKYRAFLFNPRINSEEPKFATGQHYYFISTSRGFESELKTRKVSGSYGSCERYHMKLHIYVCDPKKEDCVWEMPRCNPLPALYREMRLIDGKLPAPTKPTTERPQITTIKRRTTTKENDDKFQNKITSTKAVTTPSKTDPTSQALPLCNKKKETSIHLILNFVLGGIAVFMAIVIIILVFGLSSKPKSYNVAPRAAYPIPNSHDPKNYLTMEVIQFPDGHTQLSPVIISRTPPTTPHHIVDQIPRRMAHHLPNTPPESPNSNEERTFVFPERRHSYSGTSSARNSHNDPMPV